MRRLVIVGVAGLSVLAGCGPPPPTYPEDPGLGQTSPCGLWVFESIEASVPGTTGPPPKLAVSVSKGVVPVLHLPARQGFSRRDELADPLYFEARTLVYVTVVDRSPRPRRTVARLTGGVGQIIEDGRIVLADEAATVAFDVRCVQAYWPPGARPTAGGA